MLGMEGGICGMNCRLWLWLDWLVARSILKPIFGRTDALESCSRDREKRGARLTVDPSTDACQLKLECRALQQQSAADRLDSTNLPPCALL